MWEEGFHSDDFDNFSWIIGSFLYFSRKRLASLDLSKELTSICAIKFSMLCLSPCGGAIDETVYC